MIRNRNKDDYVVFVSVPGTQTAAANKFCALAPFRGFLKAVYARLGTAGTTGSQTVDINANGTSLFGGTALTFASTATAPTYGTPGTNPPPVAKGDSITIDVDAIHTTPAVNLEIVLVFSRTKQAGRLITGAIEQGIGFGF